MSDRPEPKPGILDIQAYVPGKAKAEGVENPVKLSSNENILGSSPAARAAFAAAADTLHIYPDSRATIVSSHRDGPRPASFSASSGVATASGMRRLDRRGT